MGGQQSQSGQAKIKSKIFISVCSHFNLPSSQFHFRKTTHQRQFRLTRPDTFQQTCDQALVKVHISSFLWKSPSNHPHSTPAGQWGPLHFTSTDIKAQRKSTLCPGSLSKSRGPVLERGLYSTYRKGRKNSIQGSVEGLVRLREPVKLVSSSGAGMGQAKSTGSRGRINPHSTQLP